MMFPGRAWFMEETMENLKREGKQHELFASGEARDGRDKGGRAEGVSRGFPQAPSLLVWVFHCCPDKGSPAPAHNCSLSASLSILAVPLASFQQAQNVDVKWLSGAGWWKVSLCRGVWGQVYLVGMLSRNLMNMVKPVGTCPGSQILARSSG